MLDLIARLLHHLLAALEQLARSVLGDPMGAFLFIVCFGAAVAWAALLDGLGDP